MRHAMLPAAVLIFVVWCVPSRAEDPIATLAFISNPYITTQPADQIKDERGGQRGFLAQLGPTRWRRPLTWLTS